MRFTLFFTASQRQPEDAALLLRMAETVLMKGHHLSLVVSGEAVRFFLKRKVLPVMADTSERLEGLARRGAKIYIDEAYASRCYDRDDFIESAEVCSPGRFLMVMDKSDILISI